MRGLSSLGPSSLGLGNAACPLAVLLSDLLVGAGGGSSGTIPQGTKIKPFSVSGSQLSFLYAVKNGTIYVLDPNMTTTGAWDYGPKVGSAGNGMWECATTMPPPPPVMMPCPPRMYRAADGTCKPFGLPAGIVRGLPQTEAYRSPGIVGPKSSCSVSYCIRDPGSNPPQTTVTICYYTCSNSGETYAVRYPGNRRDFPALSLENVLGNGGVLTDIPPSLLGGEKKPSIKCYCCNVASDGKCLNLCCFADSPEGPRSVALAPRAISTGLRGHAPVAPLGAIVAHHLGLGALAYFPNNWDFSTCTYTLGFGTTISDLAALYGTTVHEINLLNPPGDPAVYGKATGAKIRMPESACAAAKAMECPVPGEIHDATGACVNPATCPAKQILRRNALTGQVTSLSTCNPVPGGTGTGTSSGGGGALVVAGLALGALALVASSSKSKSKTTRRSTSRTHRR